MFRVFFSCYWTKNVNFTSLQTPKTTLKRLLFNQLTSRPLNSQDRSASSGHFMATSTESDCIHQLLLTAISSFPGFLCVDCYDDVYIMDIPVSIAMLCLGTSEENTSLEIYPNIHAYILTVGDGICHCKCVRACSNPLQHLLATA